jgi:hypothetical protein
VEDGDSLDESYLAIQVGISERFPKSAWRKQDRTVENDFSRGDFLITTPRDGRGTSDFLSSNKLKGEDPDEN